jgi:phenylpropionate dioxygenase-like ring-hydroxylating dioxygenase large terminal subunit
VVFRDTEGRLGVLGEHCLHRRASLAFGRNEECGLRCLYHGWKFDVEGNVVDMPSELPGTAARLGKKAKAYPVREGGGFVWVWMGPPGELREWDPPAWGPDREDARGLQLGPGARGFDRFGAQLEPPLHQHAARRGGGLHRHRFGVAASLQ